MSSSSIGSIALGVVGAVVGFFIGGPVGALYGFSLGAITGGLLFPPEFDQGGDLRPDEVQFTNSTESQTIPVIFGTVRVPGNHIGYDPDSFRAVEQFQEQEGGKGGGGGGQVSAGFLYYLTWEVGLCMGEVDELVDVQGSPGEDSVVTKKVRIEIIDELYSFSAAGNLITQNVGLTDLTEEFTPGQDITVTGALIEGNNGEYRVQAVTPTTLQVTPGRIAADEGPTAIEIKATTYGPPAIFGGAVVNENFNGDEDLQDGGSVRIFPGTMTQTNAEGDNRRGVAFARFRNFQMGRSSSPRTYLFVMRRMPRCRDSAGAIIPTIATRAANDASLPEWEDANPAAVVWEMMTQGFDDGVTVESSWGKAMSPDKLNQEDFETASAYYQDKRIGVSTSIGGGSDSIRDLLAKFRDIFGLWVWWDGEQLRCRVFWDRDNAYTPRTRITEEDIVGEPAFIRPSQAQTSNEIRLQFTNRRNNFQKEAITRQDLGNIETQGQVRSQSFESKEVGTRRAADLLTGRLLRRMSYPTANLQFKIQRHFAFLQPGAFVEVVWDTWRQGAVTSFWRVVNVQDDETSDNAVTLTLEEDQFATARDGEISDFTLPIVSVDVDVPLDDGDFDLIDYAASSSFGEITPILADELPVWVSGGSRRLAAAIQRRNGGIQTISVGYAESPFTDYQTLGVASSFAITGQLPNGLPLGSKIIRDARPGEHFDLTLNVADDETEFLNATGKVSGPSDSFSLLTADFSAILVVGTEIIRVGLAEEDTPGVYTVKNAIRGEFGTEIEAHAALADFWFFPIFDRATHSIEATALPRDVATNLRVQAFSGNASSDPEIFAGPDAGGFGGRSIAGMTPSLYTAERSGTDWTVRLRPRIHTGGAGYGPNLESEFQSREANLGELLFRVTASNGDSILLSDYFVLGSITVGDMTLTRAEFIPSDGTNPDTSGLLEFDLSFSVNPASLDFLPVLAGVAGDALTVDQPL